MLFQAAQHDFNRAYLVITESVECACNGNGCIRCYPLLRRCVEDPRILQRYLDFYDARYLYIGDNTNVPKVVQEATQHYLNILRQLDLLE